MTTLYISLHSTLLYTLLLHSTQHCNLHFNIIYTLHSKTTFYTTKQSALFKKMHPTRIFPQKLILLESNLSCLALVVVFWFEPTTFWLQVPTHNQWTRAPTQLLTNQSYLLQHVARKGVALPKSLSKLSWKIFLSKYFLKKMVSRLPFPLHCFPGIGDLRN